MSARFGADFAEDYTKTNWGLEWTWIPDVAYGDTDAYDGIKRVDTFNLTISMDRPPVCIFSYDHMMATYFWVTPTILAIGLIQYFYAQALKEAAHPSRRGKRCAAATVDGTLTLDLDPALESIYQTPNNAQIVPSSRLHWIFF